MSAESKDLIRPGEASVSITAVDGRVLRAAVVTLVIGGYMALGAAFQLGAEAYLLLGIPITIAFQLLVVRRPLRSFWLREAPPLAFTTPWLVAIVVVAIAPAVVAARGARDGDLALLGWGVASMVGSVGAIYCLRAMDRDAVRSTVRTSLITGAVLVAVMVAYRLISGGLTGNVTGALVAATFSVATYLPVVFVLEEVLFRGVIDTYLHGSTPGADRATALYGSALWGLWHLPVALALGILTVPYLVVVHTAIGYFLVVSWRKTGNLAAPGIAHGVIDALRNGLAVL